MKSFKEFLTERLSSVEASRFSIEELNKITGLKFNEQDGRFEAEIDDSDVFIDKFYSGKYIKELKASFNYRMEMESPFLFMELEELLGSDNDPTDEDHKSALYRADSEAYEEIIRSLVEKHLPPQLSDIAVGSSTFKISLLISEEEASRLLNGETFKDIGISFDVPDIKDKEFLKYKTNFNGELSYYYLNR